MFNQDLLHDESYNAVQLIPGDDIVQCVPTKKGHQILFKGYTYVFKARLQCGSEQWCCSYRQKTGCISTINMQSNGVEVVRDFHNHKKPMFTVIVEVADEGLPEWVSIYFVKNSDTEFQCNLCETTINLSKNSDLLEHIKSVHKDIYDLHKENPEATVGFRIEFLHLNVGDEGEQKNQPVILGEVCEAATEEVITQALEKDAETTENVSQLVLKSDKGKARKTKSVGDKTEHRKRSWVWKYFNQMSHIIFQCTLCHVVLSIKGCNTNNMNRHFRTRHPVIYKAETITKLSSLDHLDSSTELTEVETPVAIKTEEISACEKDSGDILELSTIPRQRRSWIWTYFNRISATSAQCKLCNRNIIHGGNATGNMNRHLKMIHHKTGDEHHWVWKVFENNTEDDFCSCKICNYRCTKFTNIDRTISLILEHLKNDHGVISGDQIITGTEECEEEEDVMN